MSGRDKPGRRQAPDATGRVEEATAQARAVVRELHELIQEARDVQRAWKEDKHDFAGDLNEHFRAQIDKEFELIRQANGDRIALAVKQFEELAGKIHAGQDSVYDALARFAGARDAQDLLNRISASAARKVAETIMASGKTPQIVDMLRTMGVTVTDDPANAPPGSVVLDMLGEEG